MKKSTVKKIVLSTALSAALVASFGSAYKSSYNQINADSCARLNCQTHAETVSNQNFNDKQIEIYNNGYVSQSMEAFVKKAIGGEIEHIDFVYNALYTAYNELYGYVLDFTHDNGQGFIIFSVSDGAENVVEMNLINGSPYAGKDGKYIYISFNNYFIEYVNGTTVKITSGGEEYEAKPGGGPLKSKDKGSEYFFVDYDYSYGSLYQREIRDFHVEYSTRLCPDKSNNCANAAGVIALNYWNAYHANDLLKLRDDQKKKISPYMKVSTNMNDETAKKYMNIFYDYMDTNWLFGIGGTLPGDCYDGYMRLIAENGYVPRKFDVKTFFDIKYQINTGVPIFIVSDNYYFTGDDILPEIYNDPGENILKIFYYRYCGIKSVHTFVGFGYAEYTYYDADGKERQIHLVEVADGWGYKCYFNFDISSKMSMAAIRVSRC